MPAPPLKIDPKYGYFPHWPQDGDDWVHPDDATRARAIIPSPRIFRREGRAGDYFVLHYGEATIRAHPALWHEVAHEGIEIGDWVEVLARGMLNEPLTGTVCEMLWDEKSRAIRYQIASSGRLVEQLFAREDLQPTEPV